MSCTLYIVNVILMSQIIRKGVINRSFVLFCFKCSYFLFLLICTKLVLEHNLVKRDKLLLLFSVYDVLTN